MNAALVVAGLALVVLLVSSREATTFPRWAWKDPADAGAWEAGHDERLEILMHALADFLTPYGITPLVTSYVIGRDRGPHLDGRALDVRTYDWPQGLPERAAAYLRAAYPTPPAVRSRMPTAIHETPETHPRATGPHLHLQVARWEAGEMAWYQTSPGPLGYA